MLAMTNNPALFRHTVLDHAYYDINVNKASI